MYEERIEVENNIIVAHVIGETPPPKEGIEYIFGENIQASLGTDIRIYKDIITGEQRPLKELVEDKLIEIPEGKKLNKAEDGFEDLSEAEKVEVGLRELDPKEKIENGQIVQKSKKELFDEGLITKDEYNEHIRQQRENAYAREADGLYYKFIRKEIPEQEWLDKIKEIRERFPKVE